MSPVCSDDDERARVGACCPTSNAAPRTGLEADLLRRLGGEVPHGRGGHLLLRARTTTTTNNNAVERGSGCGACDKADRSGRRRRRVVCRRCLGHGCRRVPAWHHQRRGASARDTAAASTHAVLCVTPVGPEITTSAPCNGAQVSERRMGNVKRANIEASPNNERNQPPPLGRGDTGSIFLGGDEMTTLLGVYEPPPPPPPPPTNAVSAQQHQ